MKGAGLITCLLNLGRLKLLCILFVRHSSIRRLTTRYGSYVRST
jgi:hypothetical protein